MFGYWTDEHNTIFNAFCKLKVFQTLCNYNDVMANETKKNVHSMLLWPTKIDPKPIITGTINSMNQLLYWAIFHVELIIPWCFQDFIAIDVFIRNIYLSTFLCLFRDKEHKKTSQCFLAVRKTTSETCFLSQFIWIGIRETVARQRISEMWY